MMLLVGSVGIVVGDSPVLFFSLFALHLPGSRAKNEFPALRAAYAATHLHPSLRAWKEPGKLAKKRKREPASVRRQASCTSAGLEKAARAMEENRCKTPLPPLRRPTVFQVNVGSWSPNSLSRRCVLI
jgi:hypothetical protein